MVVMKEQMQRLEKLRLRDPQGLRKRSPYPRRIFTAHMYYPFAI